MSSESGKLDALVEVIAFRSSVLQTVTTIRVSELSLTQSTEPITHSCWRLEGKSKPSKVVSWLLVRSICLTDVPTLLNSLIWLFHSRLHCPNVQIR